MLELKSDLLEPTLNKFGSMHRLTPYSKIFIGRCIDYNLPVLDVGCAYGVASIPALLNEAKVIANDLDNRHLDILTKRVPIKYLNNLVCLAAKYPYFDLMESSLSCVHLSLVLSFLNGDEVEKGFKKINKWLNKGGEIFIINHTPYVKMIESYLPHFEKNILNGNRWPGYINDIFTYSEGNKFIDNIPSSVHQFDIDTIIKELELSNFVIERAEYFTLPNIPNEYKLDGREFLGVIAKKEKLIMRNKVVISFVCGIVSGLLLLKDCYPKDCDYEINQVIKKFNLKPLNFEGGYFSQTYLLNDVSGKDSPKATAIIYLLTKHDKSLFHKLSSDEIYHYYAGDPLRMITIDSKGNLKNITLGSDILHGQNVQVIVKKGIWQGSYLPHGCYALLGTTMTPGFNLKDFELGNRKELLIKYPKISREIVMLTS